MVTQNVENVVPALKQIVPESYLRQTCFNFCLFFQNKSLKCDIMEHKKLLKNTRGGLRFLYLYLLVDSL